MNNGYDYSWYIAHIWITRLQKENKELKKKLKQTEGDKTNG